MMDENWTRPVAEGSQSRTLVASRYASMWAWALLDLFLICHRAKRPLTIYISRSHHLIGRGYIVSGFEFYFGSTPSYIPSSARNPPQSSHWIGWTGKRLTNKPLVASSLAPFHLDPLFSLASRHPQPLRSDNAMKLQCSGIFREIVFHSS